MPVKLAELKPIFKKGKKTDPSNYKPSSLWSSISKFLKRVIHNQTNAFLKGNNLLYNYQSGFRTNHSTNQCLSLLTGKILKGIDEGLLTGMILIDLKKAFNTINHEILFKKLKANGFSEWCITWFQSYLSKRIFFISIETFWLWRNIVWCSTGFDPRAYTFPYLCKCNASSCGLKFAFICWRFVSYVLT